MTNLTVTTRATTEEVAGKHIKDVVELGKRLGHEFPFKSGISNGIWVNVYKLKAA